jgi:hypothetical protein
MNTIELYRDATFTRETRDKLADLREWLAEAQLREWHDAVDDVVCRWDANEATETTF